MGDILEKKISRKDFLKVCALLLAGFVSLTSLDLTSKKDKENKSYGKSVYGG